MAVYNRQVHKLQDIYLFAAPNKALSEIAVGPRLTAIVTDYTNRVLVSYVGLVNSQPHKDPKRALRAGGHPPGTMLANTSAHVGIGGAKKDRVVGEVRSKVDYSGATEKGRSNPTEGQRGSTYRGTHNLRNALYMNLRPI